MHPILTKEKNPSRIQTTEPGEHQSSSEQQCSSERMDSSERLNRGGGGQVAARRLYIYTYTAP